MCKCINIDFGSAEQAAQSLTVEIPHHMEGYRQARLNAGLSGLVSIDPCIFDEIKGLWSRGIITYGSCCGHNKQASFVNVDEKDIDIMISLGYVQNHWEKGRQDTFKLKSA